MPGVALCWLLLMTLWLPLLDYGRSNRPLAERLVETAGACTGDVKADVAQFLKLEPVFSRELAGNAVFVAALEKAGLAAERIHVERFGDVNAATAHHVEDGDADHAKVALVMDGLTRDVEFRLSDLSILDAARRAGEPPLVGLTGGLTWQLLGELKDKGEALLPPIIERKAG